LGVQRLAFRKRETKQGYVSPYAFNRHDFPCDSETLSSRYIDEISTATAVQ